MEKGILVGSDRHLEWMLPWWWDRYRRYNTLPVAFVDFGMSEEKRIWCRERGEILSLFDTTAPIDSRSDIERIRSVWFRKPSACKQTPFSLTLWLDIDCEVLCCLDAIFSYIAEKELAVALDRITRAPEGCSEDLREYRIYNGGVIVFRKDSSLVEEWVEVARTQSDRYRGDDDILSERIAVREDRIAILPPAYNRRIAANAPLLDAKIVHWTGDWGKACIANKGGLSGFLEGLPILRKAFEASQNG